MTDLEFAIQYALEHQEECLADIWQDLDELLIQRGVVSIFDREPIVTAAINSIPSVVVVD